MTSLNNKAAKGIPIAQDFLEKCAPPNNAIAPIAVKLGGCGKKRVLIAANTSTIAMLQEILILFIYVKFSMFKIKKLSIRTQR